MNKIDHIDAILQNPAYSRRSPTYRAVAAALDELSLLDLLSLRLILDARVTAVRVDTAEGETGGYLPGTDLYYESVLEDDEVFSRR